MGSKKANFFVPDDLLFLIFSWLPVKSLLRFRCVSKSIRTLIDSPIFVRKHLDQSLEKRSDFDIIITEEAWGGRCAEVFSLDFCLPDDLNFAKATRLDYRHYPIRDVFGPTEELKLIGTCNGILCLANCLSPIAFLLWNPSTGKFRIIETSFDYEEGFDTYYFGYNHVQDDYVLVRFSKGYRHKFICYWAYKFEIYSLRMDSWKKINGTSPFPRFFTFLHYSGIFVHNAIHWLAGTDSHNRPEYIVALDLETETFRVVPTPPLRAPGEDYRMRSLGELGGRLCLNYEKISDKHEFPLWVMEEYGNQESWTLLLNVIIRPESSPSSVAWFHKPIMYSKCSRYLLAQFNYGYCLKWCHLDGTAPSDIAIDGMPEDADDAFLCLRTLVQL